ncbi:MAG: chromosomal replication initiator protein DnaA [Firmicutes bacterium]|nr:chromosomal replication initiator protein DnaA [Bacillota bacterium]
MFLSDAEKKNWAEALGQLERELTAVSFDLWVKSLTPLEKNGQLLYLVSPSDMAITQIASNHSAAINGAINQYLGCTSFKLLNEAQKDEYLKARKKAGEPASAIAKDNVLYSYEFNPKFTFENFVVGKSNQVVYAAAYSVANDLAKKFNPLFIYGGAGLGKTHILHAIGNYLREKNSQLKITYVTCERFTNDYIDAMRFGKDVTAFRDKYRNSDVLMVDDIQFISNKTGTQEEFFHTFNELHQAGRQIIITSDRPPKEIATLEERLRSRFASGLLQDIGSPDFETRVAILQKKALVEGWNADDAVYYFIAEKIESNIREMEGVLSKVCFYAGLSGKNKAGIEHAHEALKYEISNAKENITADKIIDVVCKYYNVNKSDLMGKKKNKEIVDPRMICMYLMTELLDIPLTSIGKIFARDHTTVIHARDKITDGIRKNNKLKTAINDIRNMLVSTPYS